jgi:hypothetical protein
MANPYNSMRTYADHATINSWEVAGFTLDNFPTELIAKVFTGNKHLFPQYAITNVELISTFISKTPSQRGPNFRKITKKLTNDESKVMFLLACIIQIEKSEKSFWIRDDNVNAFIPGHGNRKTVAEMNSAITNIYSLFLEFKFPFQAFYEAGHSFNELRFDNEDED